LPSKSAKESQDICFIEKPNTTKKYLWEKFGNQVGVFVEKSSGKVIGKHEGFYQYTIGQRKGIGIAYPYPLYVLDIDAKNNVVYLGKEEENYRSSLIIKDINLSYPISGDEFSANVKIRYNMVAVPAHVKLLEDRAEVCFDTPVNSVTSGQACVFYDKNDAHLIGGGEII
jgi:tRNA-specific 2-thiouridylase